MSKNSILEELGVKKIYLLSSYINDECLCILFNNMFVMSELGFHQCSNIFYQMFTFNREVVLCVIYVTNQLEFEVCGLCS